MRARETRNQAWQRVTFWPLLIAGVAFLVAYSWQVIGNLTGAARAVTQVVFWGTWGVFALNYLVSLWLAPRRFRWFVTHLHELAFVVLPALRPLLLITLLGVFQRAADRALRGRFLGYAASAAAIITYTGALSVLDVERAAPGSSITTFPTAIWWATTTLIGVGELLTVTVAGKVIAVGLMLTGMALVGALTASLASWLVDETDDADDEERERLTRQKVADVRDDVAALRGEVGALHAELRALRHELGRREDTAR